MQNVGILVLRIAVGLMMMFPHGWTKLINFGQRMNSFPDPLGIGSKASLSATVFAEFFCSILIIVGFKTRIASIPLVITMLVAAFVVHAPDPWGGKEKAILYAVIYLVLLFLGSGKFSVDGLTGGKGTNIKAS